jgi:hypothetical protein
MMGGELLVVFGLVALVIFLVGRSDAPRMAKTRHVEAVGRWADPGRALRSR